MDKPWRRSSGRLLDQLWKILLTTLIRIAPGPRRLRIVKARPVLLAGLVWFLLHGLLSQAIAQQAAADLACRGRIVGFAFVGNDSSQPELLVKRSGLMPGQMFDQETLRNARQKLMDLALFKDVKVFSTPDCAEEAVITLQVKEKYYHLVYPRLKRNGDGDIAYGVRYRGSNLFGLDQSLVLGYTESDLANGEQSESIGLSYQMPLVNSPYEYRWEASREETALANGASGVLQTQTSMQFLVGRKWISHSYKQPILVLASLNTTQNSLQGPLDLTTIEAGSFNSAGVRLEYDDVHEQPHRRYGRFLALDFSRGFDWLGRDYSAPLISAELRHYQRLNVSDNLNTRVLVSLSDTAIFAEPRFEIGGSGSLRGLETDFRRGNHLWLFNVEYIMGLDRYPAWRVALFSDLGNVFAQHDEFDRHGWQVTVGAGLRWKIESFVKTDLVVDYGYSPQTGYSRFYVSTSLPF
jgi:outer membrane protein assembly factor BamA